MTRSLRTFECFDPTRPWEKKADTFTLLQVLKAGTAYDRRYLRFVGWRTEGGQIPMGDESVAGYHEAHYWDTDGRYLGPDSHGIIPVYEFTSPE